MSEESAFLAGIRAEPKDDLRRLVYADWLDEYGQSERAEFIRVQCELEKLHAGTKRQKHLKKHERQLWFGGVKREFVGGEGKFNKVLLPILAQDLLSRGFCADVVVRRGFIAEVRCTLPEWIGGVCGRCGGDGRDGILGINAETCPACSGTGRTSCIGPKVITTHPVERVVVTDREPSVGQECPGFQWWSPPDIRRRHEGEDVVPVELLELMRADSRENGRHRFGHRFVCFPTRKIAFDALSISLIAWAKSQPVPA